MRRTNTLFAAAALALGLIAQTLPSSAQTIRTAILAGGCFWCVEADFDKLDGVVDTTSGFSGGSVANPTYKQVTKGGSGHLEVVRIRYDAEKISYRQLVDHFWRTVDPSDAGGQFCDRGESYTTAVFARGAKERAEAEASRVEAQAALGRNIVTPIRTKKPFYAADGYHQNYYQSSKKVLTRFGLVAKAKAYKKYRSACGRDKRIKAVWGGLVTG
jgi:peptide-methionine (S)-S-oxide reductase